MLLVAAPISGRDQSLRPLDGETSDDEKEVEATKGGGSACMRAVPFPVPTPLTRKMLGGDTRSATYRSRAGATRATTVVGTWNLK